MARRALTVLIAVALTVLPVGAATAGLHAPMASAATASTHQGHATQHHHGDMHMATTADRHGAGHCDRTEPDSGCCDDKGTCMQTCLQKCFGQLAVMPPERSARQVLMHRFAAFAAERLPGWSLSPQPPPPRV